MVVIRLARFGAKHNPQYRVMVADSRRSSRGRFIDNVGHYDPLAGEGKGLVLELERIEQWIAKGAQPTDRVQRLLKRAQAAN